MNSSSHRQGQIPGRGSLVGERPGGKVARAPGLSVGQAAAPEWAGGAFLAASTWGPFVPGARSLVRRPLSLRYRKRPNTQAATAAETDSGPTPGLISDTKSTAVNRV